MTDDKGNGPSSENGGQGNGSDGGTHTPPDEKTRDTSGLTVRPGGASDAGSDTGSSGSDE
jgi:hypothetical protein